MLATINARYIHSAFGLRYLKANLGNLEEYAQIKEFTLDSRPEDIVESLLQENPKIVGLGVYIWNIVESERVLSLLKVVSPETVVVLGGPEVSYEQSSQRIVELADYVISGWGEVSFRTLATAILAEQCDSDKLIVGEQPKLNQIKMPYYLYEDKDIAHRVLYVEASRGCPFKCEFCLSALDKTAWPFDLEIFLNEMDQLFKRGARHFKFVDRTFNLKVKNSLKIMQFFLDRLTEDTFLHFEVVPDHLPEALKEMIAKFPPGQLQFEVGIQTFNPEVQAKISRRQDNEKAENNIHWIRNHSSAHLHTDLIFGLPGEDLSSFAESFDQLVKLNPHEIQVGILKRLKGSPIIRHTQAHDLRFNPSPPYSIISSDTVSFEDVQFVSRFARYWDLIGNSGRFKATLPLLLGDQAFANFGQLTKSLYDHTGQTHKISLLRLYDFVYEMGVVALGLESESLKKAISDDFQRSGLKSIPKCLSGDRNKSNIRDNRNRKGSGTKHAARQLRH